MVIFNEAGNLQCLSHLELTVWIWLSIIAPVVRLVWQFLLRLWDYKTVLFIDYAAICLFIHQPSASIPLSGYSFFVKNTNLASAYCICHGLHEARTLLLCPLFNLIEWIWPLIALSLASVGCMVQGHRGRPPFETALCQLKIIEKDPNSPPH
jgi:hypothetical protein